MQDRFKFRAYDKEKRRMLYAENNESVEIMGDGSLCGFNLEREWTGGLNMELMQCTGLEDKNDKLIYEGDILELYVSSEKLYRYEVKYEIGSFMLVSDDEIFDFKNVWNDNVYPLSQLYWEYQNEENCIYQCEVIGNIYENPKLLKEVK